MAAAKQVGDGRRRFASPGGSLTNNSSEEARLCDGGDRDGTLIFTLLASNTFLSLVLLRSFYLSLFSLLPSTSLSSPFSWSFTLIFTLLASNTFLSLVLSRSFYLSFLSSHCLFFPFHSFRLNLFLFILSSFTESHIPLSLLPSPLSFFYKT